MEVHSEKGEGGRERKVQKFVFGLLSLRSIGSGPCIEFQLKGVLYWEVYKAQHKIII